MRDSDRFKTHRRTKGGRMDKKGRGGKGRM